MDLGGAGLAQHPHQGPLGVAAHDGVVDDDEALALDDLAQGVELEADAELAQGLGGLDEGAPHVGVLHQALPVGDAGGLGVADGGGGARLGGGDDEVGFHRVLAGQGRSHLVARGDDAAPGDAGVGAGQVDVLEDAAGPAGGGETRGAHTVLVDFDELAGLDLAHEGGTDDVQGGSLGGHGPPVAQAPQHQGAHSVGVAGGVEGALVHEDQGEGAAQHGQDPAGGLVDAQGCRCAVGGLELGVVGDAGGEDVGGRVPALQGAVLGDEVEQGGQDGGVGGGAAAELAAEVLPGGGVHGVHELAGVGEVAVVGQGEGGAGRRTEHRLGVLPGGGALGGVADVADGDVTGEVGQGLVVEDLGDQAEVLVDEDLGAVGGGDAGRLLAAVLEGVQAEVGQAGDLLAGGPHAEDTALLAWRGLELVGVVVGQGGQARDAGGYLGCRGRRRGPGSLRDRRIGRARAAGPPQGLGGVGPRCRAGAVGMVGGDLRGVLTGAHTHSLSRPGAV